MIEEQPRIHSIERHGTSLPDFDGEPMEAPGCLQRHGGAARVDSIHGVEPTSGFRLAGSEERS